MTSWGDDGSGNGGSFSSCRTFSLPGVGGLSSHTSFIFCRDFPFPSAPHDDSYVTVSATRLSSFPYRRDTDSPSLLKEKDARYTVPEKFSKRAVLELFVIIPYAPDSSVPAPCRSTRLCFVSFSYNFQSDRSAVIESSLYISIHSSSSSFPSKLYCISFIRTWTSVGSGAGVGDGDRVGDGEGDGDGDGEGDGEGDGVGEEDDPDEDDDPDDPDPPVPVVVG